LQAPGILHVQYRLSKLPDKQFRIVRTSKPEYHSSSICHSAKKRMEQPTIAFAVLSPKPAAQWAKTGFGGCEDVGRPVSFGSL
jgi:hypothetical protein